MSQIFDKKELKEIYNNMGKLGLDEKESKVYIYLLGLDKEVGTSKIVENTRLHGQYVYDALNQLESLGMVKHLSIGERKKWLANAPDRLNILVEEKKVIANTLTDQLNMLYTKKHEQDFEIYQGDTQFIANEFNMIDEASHGSSILIITGKGDKFSEKLSEQRRPYNAKAIDKRIIIKYIGSEDQREYLEWVKQKRQYFDYRILPGLSSSSVSTSIHEKAVLLQVYGEPLLVFKLKSKQIADDYRSFFDALWKVCSI